MSTYLRDFVTLSNLPVHRPTYFEAAVSRIKRYVAGVLWEVVVVEQDLFSHLKVRYFEMCHVYLHPAQTDVVLCRHSRIIFYSVKGSFILRSWTAAIKYANGQLLGCRW
jgi:hypothetical protein